MNCTSEHHSDFHDLKQAIAIFQELTAHIDSAKAVSMIPKAKRLRFHPLLVPQDVEALPDLERIQEKLDGFQVQVTFIAVDCVVSF